MTNWGGGEQLGWFECSRILVVTIRAFFDHDIVMASNSIVIYYLSLNLVLYFVSVNMKVLLSTCLTRAICMTKTLRSH